MFLKQRKANQAFGLVLIILLLISLVVYLHYLIHRKSPGGEGIHVFFENHTSLAFLAIIMTMLIVIFIVGFVFYFRQRIIYNQLLRKSTELSRSRENLEKILYSIGEGVIITDSSGFIKNMNPKAEALTGWREAEAVGKNIESVFVIIDETTKKPIDNPVFRMLNLKDTSSIERNTVLISKDGVKTPVDDSCSSIKDADGSITGAIIVFSDSSFERLRQKFLNMRLGFFEYSVDHSHEETLTKILDDISEYLKSPIAFFLATESDHKKIKLQGWSTKTRQEFCKTFDKAIHSHFEDAGVWADCIRLREPVIHNDYEVLPNKRGIPKGHAPVKREMVVPVFRNNNIEAVVGVGNKIVDYDQADLDFLIFMADVAWEVISQKIKEEELRKSEAKMGSIFRAAPVGFGVIANRCIIEVNERFCEITGYTSEELLNKSIKILYLNESDYNNVGDSIYRDVDDLGAGTVETTWIRKDGRVIDVLITVTPHDFRDKTKGFVFSVLDITLRRNSEREIKEHERQLSSVISHLPGFVYTCKNDEEWTMLYISNGCKVITGYDPDDLLNNNKISFNEIIKDEYRSILHDEWSRVLKFQWPLRLEYQIVTADNEIRWVLERGNGVYDSDGNLLFLEGYIEDITEQKENETELVKAKEKAEESDYFKSAFLANVSHEIRTPMNGILGFLDLLQEADLNDEDRDKYIDIINKSGLRLLETINAIIELSKIDIGESKLNIESVDISEIMRYQLNFFKPQAESRGLGFIINETVSGEKALIDTDRQKLEGVLMNLIKNAIKFTKSGYIEVGNRMDGERLMFYVKDTGIGIQADRIDAIFERFTQADMNLTRDYEGSGLGLSIVKAYIESLNGDIWVESIPGEGSTFYFYLPYNGTIDNHSKTGATVEPKGKMKLGEVKILIAEDDINSYTYIETVLKKEGIAVVRAINGAETVEIVKSDNDIDLILMDMRMPIMDGYEATQKIREMNKEIPIVAQTAFAFAADKNEVMEAGCNDFISKPLKKAELLRIINKYLNIGNSPDNR